MGLILFAGMIMIQHEGATRARERWSDDGSIQFPTVPPARPPNVLSLAAQGTIGSLFTSIPLVLSPPGPSAAAEAAAAPSSLRRSKDRETVRRNVRGEARGKEGGREAPLMRAHRRRRCCVAAVVKSEFRGRKKTTWLFGCLPGASHHRSCQSTIELPIERICSRPVTSLPHCLTLEGALSHGTCLSGLWIQRQIFHKLQ